MNRREFVKFNIKTGLWLAAGTSWLAAPKALQAGPLPDVSVVRGDRGPATRAAVDLIGGIKSVVRPGDRVVIKPNMSFARHPEQAANSHPEVVRELVVMCLEAGAAAVRVLDHTLNMAENCLALSGIASAVEAVRPGLVAGISDGDLYRAVDIPGGRVMTGTDVMKEVLEADKLIAAPVAKSHGGAGVSLSLKGMMGLVFDRWSMHRKGLHASIVDVASVLKADLTVIDGSRVLSTNGPGGPGKVIQSNTIIASKDMVAADAQAVASFEFWGKTLKPADVEHIRLAHKQGLGRMDLHRLKVKTVSV
jgi:uncharacterized protein (DUF362 family)